MLSDICGFYMRKSFSKLKNPLQPKKDNRFIERSPLAQKLRQSFCLKTLQMFDLYLISSTTVVSILLYLQGLCLEVLNWKFGQVTKSFFLSDGIKIWYIADFWFLSWRKVKLHYQRCLKLRMFQKEHVENERRNCLSTNTFHLCSSYSMFYWVQSYDMVR